MPKWFAINTRDDRQTAKSWVDNVPPGTRITFKRHDKRNNDQNSLLWAILSNISEQKPNGLDYPTAIWKCLFMQAWGREIEYYKSLDGDEIVPIFRSSELTKAECAELIEFIYAWCAKNGVRFKQEEAA
jgi:hypothetical protein